MAIEIVNFPGKKGVFSINSYVSLPEGSCLRLTSANSQVWTNCCVDFTKGGELRLNRRLICVLLLVGQVGLWHLKHPITRVNQPTKTIRRFLPMD